MSNNTQDCSCSGGSCCTPEQERKKIEIDFLYLDLNTCQRCQGAESNLDQAINDVTAVLKAAGYEVSLNKINITSIDLATKYKFLSSPTIRINGNDIVLDVTETSCTDCGDLCGDSVDCRSWVYEGVEQPEPPKEMLVNAIMKEAFGGHTDTNNKKQEYVLPKNIEIFFDGLKTKKE